MSFKDNANTVFDQLYNDWQNWNDPAGGSGFWHMANIMHSCLDYYDTVHPDATRTLKLLTIINRCYTTYNTYKNYKNHGYWYDDYGWFANAFARAAQIDSLLNDSTTPKKKEALEVAVEIWNNYNNTFCNHPEWCPGCFSDPGTANGCNTVTNALYLDFSMRLYGLTKQEKYLTAAKKQFILFISWIGQTKNGLLTNKLGDRVNLVRWGNGSTFVDHGSDWVWIGNQGLLISGLSMLNKVIPSSDKAAYILSLYTASMKNFFDTKNILHEAPFAQTFQEDVYDYATGKGVFIRFISGSGVIQSSEKKTITDNATAAFSMLTQNSFRWSDDTTTLNFQNAFLTLWNGSSSLPSPMDWAYTPDSGTHYQLVSDMCILDAQVAAIRAGGQ